MEVKTKDTFDENDDENSISIFYDWTSREVSVSNRPRCNFTGLPKV